MGSFPSSLNRKVHNVGEQSPAHGVSPSPFSSSWDATSLASNEQWIVTTEPTAEAKEKCTRVMEDRKNEGKRTRNEGNIVQRF